MVFNSVTFVVFFACVLGLHSLPLPWTTKKINLLIASYVFYAAWNPPFVILLWVSTRTRCAGAVRAHAEQRRISLLRELRVPTRKDLNRAARRHRVAGNSFRGLSGVAGLPTARVVTHEAFGG